MALALDSSGSIIASDLHWHCVAICAHPRLFGLRVIERHRLNRLIAHYRAGCRLPKAEQYAVLRIVAVCKRRRRHLQSVGAVVPTRLRRGRKAKATKAMNRSMAERRDGLMPDSRAILQDAARGSDIGGGPGSGGRV